MAIYTASHNGRERAQAANSSRRKKRRRRNHTMHFALLIVFLLAAGAFLCLNVFFKIEEVMVVGTDKYPMDEIAAASGIVKGDNLWRIDKSAVEGALLERFPYIESVEVHRKFPPAVELAVTQCVPESAIRQGEDVVLITREGKVLERGVLMIPDNVPLVKGIDIVGAQPGRYLSEEQKERLDMLRYLLDAIEISGFTDITNVDLSDRLNIRIIYENRILLELGSETELAHKLQFVKHILENKIGPEETGVLNAAGAHKSRTIFSPGSIEEALSGNKTRGADDLSRNTYSAQGEDGSRDGGDTS